MADKEPHTSLSQSSTVPMQGGIQAITNSPGKMNMSTSMVPVETEEDLTKHEKDFVQLFGYLNERLIERLYLFSPIHKTHAHHIERFSRCGSLALAENAQTPNTHTYKKKKPKRKRTDFSCACQAEDDMIIHHGRMFLTPEHICFSSHLLLAPPYLVCSSLITLFFFFLMME